MDSKMFSQITFVGKGGIARCTFEWSISIMGSHMILEQTFLGKNSKKTFNLMDDEMIKKQPNLGQRSHLNSFKDLVCLISCNRRLPILLKSLPILIGIFYCHFFSIVGTSYVPQ